MKKRAIGLTTLILLTALATGCLPRVQRPDIQLTGVTIGGLGLQGGVIYLQVSVVNPNGFALRAEGITYDLRVREPGGDDSAWSGVVEGVYDEPVHIPARDSLILEIPVQFRYSQVGTAMRSLLGQGAISYQVSGVISVQKPVRREVPYHHSGTTRLGGID